MMTGLMTRAKALVAVVMSVALFAVAAPAMAQEVPPEQLALARKYVDLTDSAGVFEITLVEIGLGSLSQLTQQNPELADEIDLAIGKVLETYQGRKGELLDQFARVYATRFTVEELQQIVTFYESPTGRKLARANTEVNSDMQAILQVFTNNTRPEFYAKVRAELRSQGFEV
ncbi:MAG: DUF2059 domain-containing protein [Candidatus Devosia phytovorans]|uniref:DUF2059 domain-containing protein n=1 Tax=Candidatus Devosia phytovorans TaxID=3121372 RepID=A0AAJ6AYA6_9HYPH|nr:DUF2059 domain-containing protein [Devosia sp.]WEK02722.1 MAG: DUF2059 domain-containing protein [Devosia sp.]